MALFDVSRSNSSQHLAARLPDRPNGYPERCRDEIASAAHPPAPPARSTILAMPEATTTQLLNKRKRAAADEPTARPAPGFKEGDAVGQFGVENSAMDQLTAFNSNQDPQQNGNNNPAASDTAAAALHYPIGGDTSFQTQGPTGEYPDTGYLDTLKESPTQAQTQHSPGGGSGAKPAVGSEEWHKIRKDNHKEGKCSACMR